MSTAHYKLVKKGVSSEVALKLVEAGIYLPRDIKTLTKAALKKIGLTTKEADDLKALFS